MSYQYQMRFADQEQKALELGRRMAEAGFGLQDNPFIHVHPRLSSRWSSGYLAVHKMQTIASSLEQTAPRKHVARAS